MQLHVTLGRTVQTSLIHFTVYYSTPHCQDEACNRSDETQCVMSRFTLVLKVHALMKVMMGAQGTRSIFWRPGFKGHVRRIVNCGYLTEVAILKQSINYLFFK